MDSITDRILTLEIEVSKLKATETNRKPWYMSKGMIGGIISTVAPVIIAWANYRGVDPTIISAAVASLSAAGLLSTVGRATAKGGVK